MGMNRDFIGKVYEPLQWEVTEDQIRAYASAYNDDNPDFHDGNRPGGIVAPPLYNVVPTALCVAQVFFDADLRVNFNRLVHGEQDIRLLAPIRPGDTITVQSTIDDIVDKGSAELLLTNVESKNQNGEVVSRQVFNFFVRGKSHGEKEGQKKEKAPAPDRGTPIVERTMQIDEDQTVRYAEASGDRNPLHLDDDFARSVGLPSRINHGLCTMAMASKVVMDGCLDGDSQRLKRIKVRFTKPVLPGQKITTRIWSAGEGKVEFETVNDQGEPVLTFGEAEFEV